MLSPATIQHSNWYRGDIYIALFLKLSIALVLLFLSRILIYFFNPSLFSGIGFSHLMFVFFAGLRFDLFTLLIFNIPLIIFNAIPIRLRFSSVYQTIVNTIFYITNSVALAINLIDVIYFRFSQKRMTIDIFPYLSEAVDEIGSLIPVFIRDFWYIFILWIIFIIVLVWTTSKINVDNNLTKGYSWKRYLYDTLKLVVIFILFIIIGRGGLQYRPINIINAGEYTEPEFFPILLNTPFTIIKTKDKTAIVPKNYFENQLELDRIFTPVKLYHHNPEDFKNLNIVIIILESFTAEHSAFLNPGFDGGKYIGYTPFLDSLMKQSLVFKGYANGEKSIDGIPAILSGIPSLMMGPFITSPYAGDKITSVASLLKLKGYTSAFFHGGTNGTMGFEAYTKIVGFNNYFGRNEYNNDNDFDGKWGIYDEEFLQFAARQMDQMDKPFVSAIFTLSSHHPYKVPEQYIGKFPKGKLDIHESIGYADFALKQFFKSISHTEWFDNTLFVLTADHTYQGYYPFYRTSVGKYSVPIVFYQPHKEWGEIKVQTVQQTDILPSILDYLGYDKEFIAFGQSIFDPTPPHFAVSYLSGIYQLIQDGYVLKFNGEKDIAFYHIQNDSLLKNNLINRKDTLEQSMNILTKAIKQQFDDRVMNNKLTVKH
jgi:phosphoglycerol transferase MdoB-like AlkP superfamily enzyme